MTKVRQIAFDYFKKHWECLPRQYDRLLTLIKGKELYIHDIYNGQKCSFFGPQNIILLHVKMWIIIIHDYVVLNVFQVIF